MAALPDNDDGYAAGAAGSGEQAERGALSVSAALRLAKGALENVTVRVIGEVSEVSDKPGYRAVYFTVKDEGGSLPCMMWNNRYQRAELKFTVGMLVELTGRFTLYAARGTMNFDVFSAVQAGEGNLRLQVANLAKKLAAEGLTDQARKRPLPLFPETIGLVTSPRSAAVHDVLRTLRLRYPLARVLLAGVPVEGRDAAAGIARGIECVCDAGAELVLVVRGGGSFENLMPYNDEALARVIAVAPVPVVTGIGHETDTHIADMVADVRAATPTAAAAAVSSTTDEVRQLLASRARSMHTGLSHRISRSQERVRSFAGRPLFRDAAYLFSAEAQTLDVMSDRLARALPAALEGSTLQVASLAERLRRALPTSLERDRARCTAAAERLRRALPLAVERERGHAEALRGRLARSGAGLVPRFQSQVGVAASRLYDLSPLAVLGRGYAITRTEGEVVRSVAQAPPGTQVEVTVADGELVCCVEETRRVDTSIEPWEESV